MKETRVTRIMKRRDKNDTLATLLLNLKHFYLYLINDAVRNLQGRLSSVNQVIKEPEFEQQKDNEWVVKLILVFLQKQMKEVKNRLEPGVV